MQVIVQCFHRIGPFKIKSGSVRPKNWNEFNTPDMIFSFSQKFRFSVFLKGKKVKGVLLRSV